MKELLYCVGFISLAISLICIILKHFSLMFDPNQRLSNKLPPFWVYIITTGASAVCMVASYYLHTAH